MTYSVLRSDVTTKLAEYEWFRTAISLEYRGIAKAFGCTPVMAGDRLLQTFDIFWEDVENARLRHLPTGTMSLNQHKVSAYLTFWLRRINPIREIRIIQTLGGRQSWIDSDSRASELTEGFLLFGNEIAAFLVGLRISQYLTHISVGRQVDGQVGMLPVGDADAMVLVGHETAMEFAKILKYKNISAHSLNMVFQSIARDGIRN